MKLLVKLLLVLLLPWLADALQPETPADLGVMPVATESAAPLAHGAYCAPADGEAVFFGRDVPQLGSYRAFQDWCLERGGVPRWLA